MDLGEIRKLYEKGWAIHWLRPRSKIPVNPGWTSGARETWENLKKSFRKPFNVGVRLGDASALEQGYLAVIDVDIKSEKRQHRREAFRALKKYFPDYKKCPVVWSGRGNGSAHYYVRLKKPVSRDEKKASSTELVKVAMPSVLPSQKEKTKLTAKELKAGLRLRAAWEISLLSEGRQVVLPPSVHPDTGRAYRWGRSVEVGLPRLRAKNNDSTALSEVSKAREGIELPKAYESVDLRSLGLRKDQVAAIETGEEVSDRSASCFALAMALLSRGVDDDTIISIFTDPRYYLGRTGYDHAKTGKRRRAAVWFSKYCLAKAKSQVSDSVFDIEVQDVTEDPWKKKFDWTKDKPKRLRATFNNVMLVLENAVSPELLRRNQFSNDDVYQIATPWGISKGEKRSGNEDDALGVKEWLISQYKIEAPVKIIDEALNRIAAKNSFHPVKEFLEKLEWDGVERVQNAFFTYLAAEMPECYLRAVTTKFFLALIARIYEPGCKFDSLPVFEGEQDIGKSSFGRILVGDEWFMDSLPDLADKDAALNLQGIWLCEMGELSSLYRSQLETAKAFITRQTDKVRPPYGKRRVDFPRSTIFYGTTNRRDYLIDTTGNRRFWPVLVHQCDFAALERDRLQLLAEAKFMFDFCRERLYLKGKALVQARNIQESRRVENEYDAMQEKFGQWLKLPAAERSIADLRKINLEDLFNTGPFATFDKNHNNKVFAGAVLRKAGYHKMSTRYGKIWKAE